MAKTPTWAELMGSNNWEGLLQPLDLSLRRYLIQYGELAEASYDVFNNDDKSKYQGSCRYGKASFFQDVMLDWAASQYQVVAFLYSTALDQTTNWMGYIAVTNDEVSKALGRREICVVWRGSKRQDEIMNDLAFPLVPATPLLPPESRVGDQNESKVKGNGGHGDPKVMAGWLSIYISANPSSPVTKVSAREQLFTNMKQLVNKYKDEKLSITITGHSLGGSVSILSGFDLSVNGFSDIPITSFVYCCPRVGNKDFNNYLKELPNLKILHVRNKFDLVPTMPPDMLGYVESGILFLINSVKSPYLKEIKPSYAHSMEGVLHTLAGWNGEDGEFEFKVKRSLSLVNKSGDYLKDEFFIPESWWAAKNKGMVLNKDGEWVLTPPEDWEINVPQN